MVGESISLAAVILSTVVDLEDGAAATLAGFIGSSLWMLACMVVGVRQALDYKSLWKALGVVVVCWFLQAILLFLLVVLFK